MANLPVEQAPTDKASVEKAGRRAVVIFNPMKVGSEEAFRLRVATSARAFGWREPVFIATATDDPGYRMTAQALAQRPDLVMAVGGDGTVRVVSTELRGSSVPCAIVPMGTGNLLARNLHVPLDVDEALEVAFTGWPRSIDLARMLVDHELEVHYTGMAGIGFDAGLIRDTSETLKRVVGTGAYVLAFARQLGARQQVLRIQIDDAPRMRRRAVLIMVGNSSRLHAGIKLFPDARMDDGHLDLLLAAPRNLGGWAWLVHVVVQRIRRTKAVEYHAGRRIALELEEPAPWEVDGDSEGSGRHFSFEVLPGAVRVITSRAGALPD